uniref:26S proteasome non-ATPase regulatory subunit 5 n=1 Tax=Arcella intermedia TaxID=1963864 RepID=A0A6B2LAY5_9EUKA
MSVIVHLSTLNQQCFNLALEDGSLEILIKRINIEDELELLNSLELVEKIAITVHGLEYLISKGILNHFISILQKDNDGAGGLVAEKLITITGNIFRQSAQLSQILLSLPIVEIYADKLEKQFHEMPVISAIGALGRHSIGQKYLQENGALLLNLSPYFDCADNDLKIILLNAVSEMFGNSLKDENPNIHTLYTSLSLNPPTTQIMLNFIRKPFFEVRKAAYSVLYAIAKFNWGISEIAATPGLLDFLLNRQNEPEIEGLTWRFSIFEKILENPDGKQCVGIEKYYNILEYAKRGIVFVPGQSEPIVKKEIW